MYFPSIITKLNEFQRDKLKLIVMHNPELLDFFEFAYIELEKQLLHMNSPSDMDYASLVKYHTQQTVLRTERDLLQQLHTALHKLLEETDNVDV